MAMRILLVDDEKAILEIAKVFLEQEQGFKVETSLSALEALDKLKRDRFDVIVSDYQMPGMNGIELLKKLKSAGDTTPYILFTGRGREDVAIDALNNGASFYLQKGGDPESQFAELVNMIKTSARQVLAEKTLRQEKDRAQQHFDLAGVMLLALDKNGKVARINKKGCEVLGYEEDQILGKSWFESFLPESRRGDVKVIFNGLMRGELGPLEHQPPSPVLCRGGMERRIAFTNALLKNEKGEIIGTLSSGEDVTEREQAEGALRVSLAKYTTLFESLPLGVTISDKEGNIVESNREAERLLGLSREDQVKIQIDGREWRIVRLDGSPMPASEYASVRAMKENRRVTDVEMGLVKGDRSITWINVTATPIPLAGHGVAIVYTDITERKQVADALRESEERYHKLVEGMLEGVAYCQMVYDDRGHPVDWIYLNVNSNFETLTGLHDIVGKRVTEAIPGIEKLDPDLFEIYGRVASSGKPEVFESEVKSLSQRLKISVFCPEKDYFVAVFEDITKRKQTEDALKESEMKYRRLVELAQEGIWAIDVDANTTYVNPRMAEMLGYTPEEMIGRHLFSFMDERGKEIAQKGLGRQEQGVKERYDFEFLRKDGQRIYASMQTSPMMDEAGNHTDAMAVVTDITARRRTEHQANERMKELRAFYHLAEIVAREGIALEELCQEFVDILPESWQYPEITCARIVIGGEEFRTENYGESAWKQSASIKVNDVASGAIEICYLEERPEEYEGPFLKEERLLIDALAERLGHITERKKSEVVTAESLEKRRELESIIDESPAIAFIWRHDPEDSVTFVSSNIKQFGYMPEDFTSRRLTYSDFVHPEDSKRVYEESEEYAKKGASEFTQEYRILTKSGDVRWVDDRTVISRNSAGGSVFYQGIVVDITERKRVEEALKKSEAKFAIAFNSSPEMMMIGSLKDGRVIEVNNSFIRITGHSRETVIGRTIAEIGVIGEAERIRIQSAMEKKGSVEGLEIHAHAKSGDDRIALFTGAVISLEGEPCILAIISDVTDRRRAEEALRASEARFQSFMSHIPAVAYMIDASGRYLFINKAFEDAFDLKGSGVVGKTVEEVWPAATAATFRKTDQQILASQSGIELVEVVSHKGGPLELLTFKFPVPDARGTSKVLGGVSIDITERRRVEKALRQANKKLNLLGSVTRHDAINQLSVLFAWLEIAKEVARDEPIQEHLTRVSEAAKIIQRQLEFTADYQEVGVKQPEWIDLASAANKGIEGLDKGNVLLNIDLVGVKVFADSMLEKVFHNLVENAIRHGEKVTSISISARETEEGLTIICEDDGVGVSADEKEKVFLQGFGKNTGFGLYMVREVLGITGMRIRETGVPGEGARFEMLVPSGNYKVSRQ